MLNLRLTKIEDAVWKAIAPESSGEPKLKKILRWFFFARNLPAHAAHIANESSIKVRAMLRAWFSERERVLFASHEL